MKASLPNKVDEEANDKFSLLPTSTKASSEESNSSCEYTERQSPRQQLQNALRSKRMQESLPPLFIDIQEEIEQNLKEIDS